MPFRSEKQRRYMWMAHPDIAEKWAHGQHSTSQRSSAASRPSRSSSKRSQRKSSR